MCSTLSSHPCFKGPSSEKDPAAPLCVFKQSYCFITILVIIIVFFIVVIMIIMIILITFALSSLKFGPVR